MSNEYNLHSSDFSSLKSVSQKIFHIISKRLNVNTAYVALRGDKSMTALSSYNAKDLIVPEGYSLDHSDTYCQMILSEKNHSFFTNNVNEENVMKHLKITDEFKVKGFLGVTLFDLEGNVFGTLCVMDREKNNFTEEDVNYLKSMAEILSHIIELDRTKFNMGFLNVPIIPITKGVSILSIQGIVDEQRADKITQSVLSYGASHHINYFIIDLSGLIILDGIFPRVLIDLVKSLKLMGIEAILTGISPDFAQNQTGAVSLLQLNIKIVHSLETALKHIGFTLSEHK